MRNSAPLAQTLKSVQPHPDENSRQPTMDWSDGIAMMQKRNTRKLL
jgi:hypothetical protein